MHSRRYCQTLAWLSFQWKIEKSCAKWAAIAQDRANPPAAIAAPRKIMVTNPSESLTRAQYGRCISSPISLTTAWGMERSVLSALSAAVWCVRLLWLSGGFLMHTGHCAAAALSIYEAFNVAVHRVCMKYNSQILIISEYWNIMKWNFHHHSQKHLTFFNGTQKEMFSWMFTLLLYIQLCHSDQELSSCKRTDFIRIS